MPPLELAPLELAWRLGLALGLSIFLGLAFEEVYKRDDRASPGGVRTFPMLTIAGAMLYLIEQRMALAYIGGLLALAIWLYAHLCHASKPAVDPAAPAKPTGIPTLVIPTASLAAYVIGPIALIQPPWVAVALAVTSVILLDLRERLHGVIKAVPREEVLTAGKFLLLIGVILPLVPNEPVTTLTKLTPYHVWLSVVAVCTISYASYLIQRYVRIRNGALLPAVLGGLYSSTVTTIVLAKRQREAPTARADLAAGIVAATSIMYLRLGIIIALFNLPLGLRLAPALGGLFLFGAAMAVLEWRRGESQKSEADLGVPAVNPLQISTAVLFAGIFIAISVASTWIVAAFGQAGVLTLAAIVGASDIDPFVLNIAQGSAAGISQGALATAVLVASSSNNIAKAAYAVSFGGNQARRPAVMLAVLAMAGLGAGAIYLLT